jgi:hypothetical protein
LFKADEQLWHVFVINCRSDVRLCEGEDDINISKLMQITAAQNKTFKPTKIQQKYQTIFKHLWQNMCWNMEGKYRRYEQQL